MPDHTFDLDWILDIRAKIAALDKADHTIVSFTNRSQPTGSMAVLSGSFNPLTDGHVALIETANRSGFDRVLLLLPLQSVNKEQVVHASITDRILVLLDWATNYSYVDIAATNRGLYRDHSTIIQTSESTNSVSFIVGFDKIEQIFDGRYYDDRLASLELLFANASFYVAPRKSNGVQALSRLLEEPCNADFARRVHSIQLPDHVSSLSSSDIRTRVATRDQWKHLVPESVALFIEQTNVYGSALIRDNQSFDAYALRGALIDHLATNPTQHSFARLSRVMLADSTAGRFLRRILAQHLNGVRK